MCIRLSLSHFVWTSWGIESKKCRKSEVNQPFFCSAIILWVWLHVYKIHIFYRKVHRLGISWTCQNSNNETYYKYNLEVLMVWAGPPPNIHQYSLRRLVVWPQSTGADLHIAAPSIQSVRFFSLRCKNLVWIWWRCHLLYSSDG